ncbi:HNH endonuclease [Kitasatospora sp. NPDC058190]|uniref:HNH endonuclease n=1 Tax=Kitasatospora sp. NPDC058190 TaxID=3346371 RepID=UPI0036DAAD8B
MGAKRPKVPSDLRRRVLIEAGHRCAIPTCRSTPVEIAHIVPWAKVRTHEFKNLIALCPTCHARFDDPRGAIDRTAMRQYKANLNPLLIAASVGKPEQIGLLAAYQEFRVRFSSWITSELEHAAMKRKRRSSPEMVEEIRLKSIDCFAWALGATLDFQRAWENSDASGLAGAIFFHVAEWSDDLAESPLPLPKKIAQRDIMEEISEASAELHLAVCEAVGF